MELERIKLLVEKHAKKYDELYENQKEEQKYSSLAAKFDEWLKKNGKKEFYQKFLEIRGDFITSDREAIAFMLVLEEESAIQKEIMLRLQALDVLGDARHDFYCRGRVWVSENTISPFGRMPVLYTVDGYSYEEDAKKALNKVIKDGGTPYHVIRNQTNIGILYSVLYLPESQEEWDYDREDIKDRCPVVYVYNATDPCLSEYGRISIKPCFGGLLRTA